MLKYNFFDASEDVGRNTTNNDTMGDIIARRLGRRDILRGSLAVAAITAACGPASGLLAPRPAAAQTAKSSFSFPEVTAGVDHNHHVAQGYSADVLIRWGDAVLPDAPAFDPMRQTAAAQKKQFGYNNDYMAFLPLPRGAASSDHGLLVVNHEYTNEELMFPGVGLDQQGKDINFAAMTKDLVDIEMAAHGGSIVEIRKTQGKWRVVRDGGYNRRITGDDTEIVITGPAAGHNRMKTAADASGRKVIGMLNNCAGGVTPWGTWLSGEENFHGYFSGKMAEDHAEAGNHKRYGVPGGWYNWGAHHARFDVSKDPNEANRFGWVVEIDPYDPNSVPRKRTALGRFKHEGAEHLVAQDGRVVLYMGDDERFEYVYKFVTKGRFNPNDRAANMDLLDEGTLYVARYDAEGRGQWLPLVHGQGPLTEANGFRSQADVVIEARRAGDLLGATKMDRPEDVEPNPKTGKVYVMLTNNTRRKAEQVDATNPRADNKFGHIVEMVDDGGPAGLTFTWNVLVKCGDHTVADVGASFHPATTKDGWFGMPDMAVVDNHGRLWIGTDGNNHKATGRSDGLWALETGGDLRGLSKHFFRCPVGAELCGPTFTPDDRNLFVAVQHPADDGQEWAEFGRPSSFEQPATRWPDFQEGMPPRPSVVVIMKEDGGLVGS